MGRAMPLGAVILVCATSACQNSADTAPVDGGVTLPSLDPGQNEPSGGEPGDPSGPGVEPPSNDGNGAPGTETPGAADPGEPATGMTGGAAGGGAAGDSGERDDVDADAGAADDCAALPQCGAGMPCADSGCHCVTLPSCGGDAKCIRAEDACQRECGEPDCALAESYPEQVVCGS